MAKQPWDFPSEVEDETPMPRRGPGRPKGVSNKTIDQKMLIEDFHSQYAVIESMLTPKQREYYKKVFQGQVEFDPVKDGELFISLLRSYVIKITAKAFKEGIPSKEVAENINVYRQFLVNLEDMNRKREETKVKSGEHGGLVDPTRESTLGRFKGIH